MFRRSDQPQQWSVHAEFTISHPGVSDTDNAPQTATIRDENGVRMTYSWASQVDNDGNIWGSQSNAPTGPPSTYSDSTHKPSTYSGPASKPYSTYSDASTRPFSYSDSGPKPYGFQRGNMLFTSIPPSRRPYVPSEANSSATKLGPSQVQDSSGYGSDLLSPGSFASGSLPRRTVQQPYNRKCKSTCNIVLSTNIKEEIAPDQPTSPLCGRTQSLRCQTPAARSDRKDNFYGCGDPWCHHLNYGDDLSGRFSPVLEMCEEGHSAHSTARPSRASTFTVHCCEHSRASLPRECDRKDACVQTFEMIDKCTSPFMKMDSFSYKKENEPKKKYSCRRRTEPIHQRSRSPSSFTPDSLESQRTRRVIRSAKQQQIPALIQDKRGSASDSKSSDPLKKPRTVHIDVYCTGTEMESNSSNSSSESSDIDTASTPQTVFESTAMRVTHERADKQSLPHSIKGNPKAVGPPARSLARDVSKENSDVEDDASTAYPSKLSSYSTIRDFSSSISSVPRSYTSYSMSSCTVPDDYDSVTNTSWKDTFSDIDSLLQSRSSIAQTESSDFVPRRTYEKTPSIDETPEIDNNHLQTPSVSSLQQSDSFEYANSEDKMRIKIMEENLAKPGPRPWKLPHMERKHLIRQKKINDYVERKLPKLRQINKSKSRDSDSEGSDEDEKGWTFLKNDNKKLERDTTVRRACKDMEEKAPKRPETIVEEKTPHEKQQAVVKHGRTVVGIEKMPHIKEKQQTVIGEKEHNVAKLSLKSSLADQGSLSDSGSSTSKSPSVVTLRQRLSADPSLRSPFTIVPGLYTEQRYIARRFGPVVSAFKKPGHHIGPAKNPDCLCDHCKRYFEEMGYRNRTRSLGDPPAYPIQNWREFANTVNQSPKQTNTSDNTQAFTDF